MSLDGASIFAENRCLLTSGGEPEALEVRAEISAGTIIATGNYLEGPAGVAAMKLQAPGRPFTVVGNVTSGPIQVNGAPLAAPWEALNVISP
jgi:hypothetical protein